MFSGISINYKRVDFSTSDALNSDSEDDHYDEADDLYSILEDGIGIDKSIIDEYDDFDDEMESDIHEPIDLDYIDSSYIDEEEAAYYDSFEDDE